MRTITLLLLLKLISSMPLASQSIESLVALGREKLMEMAIQKINDPSFKAENYDRVIVKYNQESLLVTFKLSIVLKSKKSCYYSSVTVALSGNGGGRGIEGDCDEPEYYQATDEVKEKIQFVIDAINKSSEVGDIPDGKLPSSITMTISEHPTYYYVEVSSYSTFSHYKVSKLTGKISEAEHKHYARSHEPQEKWVVID